MIIGGGLGRPDGPNIVIDKILDGLDAARVCIMDKIISGL